MHRKVLSVLLTAALVGGLLTIGAAPASANHLDGPPPASLLPDDDGVGGLIGTALSDRTESDSAAHLTAIAQPITDQVEWRRCPTTVTAPIDNADITACSSVLGTDTEGVPLGQGTVLNPSVDEAYDLKYDITADDEANSPADVITLACVGAGRDLEGGDANCTVVLDELVSFDDASSGLPGTATTAAEMTDICTADSGGVGAGDEPCVVGGLNAGTPAEVAARFTPWEHGDPVPNEGFVVRVTTTPDLNTAGDLSGFRDWTGIGANGESDGGDQNNVPCTLLDSNASRAIWECAFADAGAADDNANQEIGVFDFPDPVGQGLCAAAIICLFDAHASQSQVRAATAATLTFRPEGDCTTTDDDASNRLGNSETVRLCVTDQFGAPFGGAATIELDTSAVTTAGFNDCGGGDPSDVGAPADHDGDGYDEHCDFTAGDGELQATFDNPQNGVAPADVGVQTVTGCFDGEAAGATDHGCADETVTDTITKTWFSTPVTVDLVYAGTGDPADPCNTGDAFKANRVGQRDDLLVCTFDEFGNAISTQETGGGRLQWTITPSGGGDRTGVEFVGSPPDETDAATAQATARIRATRRSNNDICVDLEGTDPTAPPGEEDCVQKAVRRGAGGGGRADSRVTIRDRFRGRVFSDRRSCRVNRLVIVKKVRPGKDRTIGRDRTNNRGRWRLSRPNANGRFYAKIRRTARCQGDTSRRISV